MKPESEEEYELYDLSKALKKSADKNAEVFSEAIKLNPNDAEAYFNRGDVYLWGFCDEYDYYAVKDFTEAIRLDPNYSEAYLERGKVYMKKDELEKALQDFNEVIKLRPDGKVIVAKYIAKIKKIERGEDPEKEQNMEPLELFQRVGAKEISAEERQDYLELVAKMKGFAEKARKEGILSIEKDADAETDRFLQLGLHLMCDGIQLDYINDILCGHIIADKYCDFMRRLIILQGIICLIKADSPRICEAYMLSLLGGIKEAKFNYYTKSDYLKEEEV